MRNPLILAALLVALVAAAVPPTAANINFDGGGSPSSPSTTENEFYPEVSVALALSIPPTLGVATTLEATLTANDRPISGTATLVLPPEIALTGEATHAVVLAEDAPTVLQFTIEPAFTGEHFLHLEVHETDGGRVGYRQAWLVVPATGPGTFHVDALPPFEHVPYALEVDYALVVQGEADEDGFVPSSSNAAARPFPPDWTYPDDDGSGATAETASSTFTVKVCFSYLDEANVPRAAKYVWVNVWDRDGGTDDDLLGEGFTASKTGCWTSGAIPRVEPESGRGNQDVYVHVRACHAAVCVGPTATSVYSVLTGVTTVGTQSTLEYSLRPPVREEAGWRVYQYANNAFDLARAGEFDDIGMVRVVIPSSHCDATAAACYTRADKRIHLPGDGVADKSADIVAHEYGHHVMWMAYDASYWPPADKPETRMACGRADPSAFAWREGWANFYGALTDHALAGTNGASGDRFFGALDMEIGCATKVGYESEGDVATALWDLWDGNGDQQDVYMQPFSTILQVLRDCDSEDYQKYYEGPCSWTSSGNDRCGFVMSSYPNGINYNTNPSATISSPTTFVWIRNSMTLAATATDPESCPLDVEFRLSSDDSCAQTDWAAGSDDARPYSVNFNTRNFGDDANVWACARALDGIASSSFSRSAMFGIDNSPPTGGVSVLAISLVNIRLAWRAADDTSGLAGSIYVDEKFDLTGSWSQVCSSSFSAGPKEHQGSCTRNPTVPGIYCYRMRTSDVAGNSYTSGESCTTHV